MKLAVVVSTVLIAVAGLFGNFLRYYSPKPDRLPSFDDIPYQADGYIGEEHRFSEVSYKVLKADTTTLRLYRAPDGLPFWLFVAYFSSQKYGSQIHSPKHCLPGGGWKIEWQEPFHLYLPNGVSKMVNRVFITERDKKQLLFYWFETRDGTICNEFGLKWDLMKNSLLLRPTDAVFIRLTVPIERESIEQVTERAVDFFNTFYPDMEKALPFNN